MRLEELDFYLPPEAIAQAPAEPRDSCRLMHLTAEGAMRHARFFELDQILRPGDVLVFNDSRVLPARVDGRKATGGSVEVLFIRPSAVEGREPGTCWEALVKPSRRLRVGSEILVGESDRLEVVEDLGDGRWAVSGCGDRALVELMESHGRLPLPPYIAAYPDEPSSYQTVYAVASGSAAAPTAGLHFTHDLLGRLAKRGVQSAWVTLHVGLDTFLPIRESVVEEHRIHTESYEVPAATVERLRATRAEGGRVVAVGTTVTRVLETLGQRGVMEGKVAPKNIAEATNIYITPGYEFTVVDTLLTNFHLPRSTVLALSMAFAGVDRIKSSYSEAVEADYRFFSFGDAMLIEGTEGKSVEGSRRRAKP